MVSRARRLIASHDVGRVWGGTFHAMGNRLLRLHVRGLGLTPDFTVLDQSDAADVMNLLREELGYAARERRFPRKDRLAAIYSRTVNAGDRLVDVLKRRYPWCLDEAVGIREIFRRYTERKRQQHVLDYDDLLLFCKALATSAGHRHPAGGDVRPRARRRVPGHEGCAPISSCRGRRPNLPTQKPEPSSKWLRKRSASRPSARLRSLPRSANSRSSLPTRATPRSNRPMP
jgi:hypothetical protein